MCGRFPHCISKKAVEDKALDSMVSLKSLRKPYNAILARFAFVEGYLMLVCQIAERRNSAEVTQEK